MESSIKWQPFKDLLEATEQLALNKSSSLHPLKLLLRKHKPEFLSLLKNQKRNEDDRSSVKNRSGLPVQGNIKVIDDRFIDEVLIISDLFQLNELVSFDLLITGEQQKPNYTNYSRGLVAVMLYWDGKRNLMSALRTLIQCRKGKSWTLELNEDATALATAFTDELLENGLIQQILKLLKTINVDSELEKLAKQKGLGDARHRRQVRDLITEVRQCLADCLFYFAGQSDLPKGDVLAILEYLRVHSEVDGGGKLSSTSTAVLFALLYSIKLPASAFNEEDGEEIIKRVSVCQEDFMLAIHKTITNDEQTWQVTFVRAVIHLTWSLTLRLLAQSSLSSSFSLLMNDVMEHDEMLLESALSDRVFLTLKENIVSTTNFHNEEFYLRLVHGLITDLIVNMPLKIKEMRSSGDEAARIIMLHHAEGEEIPSELRRDFQQLMELITAVYDQDPLNLQLSADFWCFTDQSSPHDGSYLAPRRTPHKQMALFKFVRQSGDILPPLLYIPYLHMLSALSTGTRSARAAFELLRTNGTNGDALISWDHFFFSCHRYFENLRQNKQINDFSNPFALLQSPVQPLVMPPKVCTITPQEVDGLRAVMKLAAKIAKYDEIACLSLLEDTHWCACGVLFGLLQCPLPVQLKGDILLLLCKLARLSSVAATLLQASEHAQLVRKRGGVQKAGGFERELEEIESRDEEYPLTRGFICFLSSLADTNVETLGETFHHYLDYIVDSVFQRLTTRGYARAKEKWMVADSCLTLFNKILAQYTPHIDDFLEDKSVSKMQEDISMQKPNSKHPGMSLLRYVYNEGNFFLTVMQMVNACIKYLDTYVPSVDMEKTLVVATEQSLQLLLYGLQLQDAFLEALRSSGFPLLLTALDKVMLGVNPESGKADYVITLVRFVGHSSNYPRLSLLAIEILSWLCSSSSHRQVVTLMINTCDQSTRQEIVHGFVEILDTPSIETSEDEDQSLVSQQREAILRLIIHCVDHPAPNFSHILLGFDPNKHPSLGNLQDPGLLGSTRSCLHSVLSILTTEGGQARAITDSPKLAELCYQIVYKLSFNRDTSEPVLRYLRSSCDFLYKHLQHVPFQTDATDNVSLMQHSWLLRTAAIELHVLASKKQRTNALRLIQVLLGQSPSTNDTNSSMIGQSLSQPDRSRLGDVTIHSMSLLNTTGKSPSTKPAMLELFDIVDLHQNFPPPLTLDQFVLSVVEEGIRSCETVNEHGVVFCDVKVLHQLLESSLSSLASEDVNRKRLANQDLQNILRTVVQRNDVRASVHSKLHFLTSWKQLLEVILTSCSDDLLLKATRQQIIFSVLQHLVTSAREVDAAQELTSSLAPIVLTLAMQIRSSVTNLHADSSLSADKELPQDVINTLSTFQVVIQGVIEWLLQSGVSQKARVSLYAALLHYLQLCQQTKKAGNQSENYSCLKSLHEGVYSRLMRENTRVFRDFGDSFKDLLCKDAFSGHSICRVLAFGCLDSILQTDSDQTWLQYMLKNGYLNHTASSFCEEDGSLQEYLNPATRPSRSVYIFEQKMALLCSIANTPGGARAIINSQVFPELAKCNFLEMRPPAEYSNDPSSATALSRYRQLLFPVLHLCISLLNALGGSTHREACAIVLQFLLSHAQPIVMAVLRSNASDHQSLNELRLVTGILCQVAGQDFSNAALYPDIPQAILMEIQASLLRIQRQIVNMLPNYLVTDDMFASLKDKSSDQESFEQTILLLNEIASNLLTYCRVSVTQSADADSALLFSPELIDSSFGASTYSRDLLQKPSMAVLSQYLQATLARYSAEQDKTKQMRYKFNNIDKLSSQDLKEILGPSTDTLQMTVAQEQQRALKKLNQSIIVKSKLTKCLLYILETAFFLFWHHLNQYVSHVITSGKAKERLLYPVKTPTRNSPRRLQDISNITADEKIAPIKFEFSPVNFNQLKTELQSSMTEPFLKKLSLVESEGSFIQILVRRMQCLKMQLN